MSERPTKRYRPGLEQLERKLALSNGPSMSLIASLRAARALLRHEAVAARRLGGLGAVRTDWEGLPDPAAPVHALPSPVRGLVLSRITNPRNPASVALTPPFRKQVRVQSIDPVPGQEYNVIFVSVFNGTRRTFTADDGLAARLSTQAPGHSYPILSGDERWEPGQTIIVYALTKQSFTEALAPPESAGFVFNLAPRAIVAIPGPSGFFRGVVFKPDTFPRVLDAIVAHGPGSRGRHLGLPDTALWQIVPIPEADIL